jgi:hypothetical protein
MWNEFLPISTGLELHMVAVTLETAALAVNAWRSRVEMWRGGFRLNISVAAPFDWRCLSGSTVTPFPVCTENYRIDQRVANAADGRERCRSNDLNGQCRRSNSGTR